MNLYIIYYNYISYITYYIKYVFEFMCMNLLRNMNFQITSCRNLFCSLPSCLFSRFVLKLSGNNWIRNKVSYYAVNKTKWQIIHKRKINSNFEWPLSCCIFRNSPLTFFAGTITKTKCLCGKLYLPNTFSDFSICPCILRRKFISS